MEIVRTELTPDDISPPTQRWDETTDEVQVTPDGGTTWNDAPGLDTRHSDAYRRPALTGGAARCDAAANMVEAVRVSVDKFLAGATVVGVATALVDIWLVLVGPIGWLAGKIILLAASLLTVTAAAVDAAFTQAVYDDLLCIFYENMDADGQVSAAQFADILTAINGLDSVVNTTLDLFFNVWGEVGLSNVGASGAETGNCTACVPEWAWQWEFSLYDGGWVYYDESGCGGGTWVDGDGWTTTTACGGGYRTTNYLDFTMPAGTVLTLWKMELSTPVSGGNVKQFAVTPSTYANQYGLNSTSNMTENHIEQAGEYGTDGASKLFFTLDAPASSGYYISRLILTGTGDVPEFSSGSLI